MKILLTGGAGRVGSATLQRLLEHGYDVRVVDTQTDFAQNNVDYRLCDINDFDAIRDAMRGMEAVIHLAAIPSPAQAFGHEVFRINVAGTFNVFESAAQEGIKRVVQASSINAFGCAYSLVEMQIDYLPLDEEHPTYTTDPYSLSKQLVEDIGAYYWRRDQISSVAMRFPWVHPSDLFTSEWFIERRKHNRALMEEIAQLSDDERRAQLAEAKRLALEHRQKRTQEYTGTPITHKWDIGEKVPLWWAYATDRFNFWSILDERDAAQALEKAVTADYEGAHALFVTDDCNWLSMDAKTLADWFFPDAIWKQPPVGAASFLNINKARELIGFEPEYAATETALA